MMRQYYTYFLLLLLLTGTFLKASAQTPQAGAKLDRTSIMLGEQTQLHLSLKFKVKDKVEFPVLKDSIGKIQIVSSSKTDTIFDKDDLSLETIHKSYTVTAFDSGEYVIPSYAFKTPAGVVSSPPLSLNVTPPTDIDTSKAFKDIKQPLTVKYTFLDWLRDNWKLVAGGFAAILVIAGIIYYFIKRPKKEVVVEEVKPAIPPHIIALQKLAEIRDKKLWQQEQTKQYYIELSDVVREYLESRYAIQALEQTSDEIFASLRYMDIAEEQRNVLRQTLILADLVKFAKEKPLPFENEQTIENAMSFVTKTQPVQVQQPLPIKEEGNK
ncbi:Oxygen tolerance [Mucilaginibacter pineti]|uniref:Oxygen tolerance n=1 Tax=Mucilaginibacter pineti TaxID=1391627 RepID=A0A1G7HHU3_9SPHI|nr:BatD family protein [Mucilaginibacter pineti]SDF00052.1 Oxygen tolerance [Mucilaginibacter pineti]